MKDMDNLNGMPHVGMSLGILDEAWTYWKSFGGRNGFGVRKCYGRKGKDNIHSSYTFVCACEGERKKDKRDYLTKNPRAETRRGCKVLLALKFDKNCQQYKVKKCHLEHNHPLQKPEACYLIPTQREVPEIALIDINLADMSGIRPKESHELLSRQAGGVRSIGYTKDDLKSCLRDKRKKAMEYGAAVSILKYFEKRASEDPFLQHFEDITKNKEIANIVWMDGTMRVAYGRFGEVVIFDTTFGTNNEKWALGTFVGLNNFREIVIFGAALMCDQTTESFAWVFTKFVEANGGKKPITMFTDQDMAIGNALKQVLPNTKHGLCVWHIMKNAQKKLCKYKKKNDKNDKDDKNDNDDEDDEDDKDDNNDNDDSNDKKDKQGLMGEFLKCLFKYEEEEEFEKAFEALAGKLDKKDEKWKNGIYECKEKWAYCFMKNSYTLGIRSTQASESMNSDLKNYLSCKLDVNRFMEQFDRVVDAKREKEVKTEYEMRKKLPRVRYNIPIICEAGKLYTPNIFELFHKECEFFGSAYIESIDGHTYTVGMCNNINDKECSRKSRQVVWNRDDQSIACSCKKFERVGILCCHAIKVLDRDDIKNIPPNYILKRWTQNANDDIVVDREERVVIEDALLEARNRHAQLMRLLGPTCDMVSRDKEKFQFLWDELCSVRERVEERYGNPSKRTNDHVQDNPNSQPENSLRLKKKDGDNRSKRRKPWNENFSRKKKGSGGRVSSSQPLIRSSNNLSQDTSIENFGAANFGCYDQLEHIHDVSIIED
ncbi:hypothetical protein LUZ63_016132 [Rhynchospora breviuscula]|uniref:SWIM-type domain-containing protein n=1 Tax=Rhynchospora breviuscula TaxID=2022672 RepID=A0A9Q0HMU5_9POAL|nr:hypothetical protein LUZ63_016132 [Rhynchospora breviuscula]